MSKMIKEIKVGDAVFVKAGVYGTYHRETGFVPGICVGIHSDGERYTVAFDENADVEGAWTDSYLEGDKFLYVNEYAVIPGLSEGDRVRCIRPIDKNDEYDFVGEYGTVNSPSNGDGIPLIDFDNGESLWCFYADDTDDSEIELVENDGENVPEVRSIYKDIYVMAIKDIDSDFPTEGLIGKVTSVNGDLYEVEFMSDKYFSHKGWDNGSGEENMLYASGSEITPLPELKVGDRVVGITNNDYYNMEGIRGTVKEVDIWDNTVLVVFDSFISDESLIRQYGDDIERTKLIWCDYNSYGDFDIRPLSTRELEEEKEVEATEEEAIKDADNTQPEPISEDSFNPTYEIGEKVRFIREVDGIFETTNCIGTVIEYDKSDLNTDSNYLFIKVSCYDGAERELYCYESDIEKINDSATEFNPTYEIGEKVIFVADVDGYIPTTGCIGTVLKYDLNDLFTDSNYLYVRVIGTDGKERDLYCYESDIEKINEIKVGSVVNVKDGTIGYTVLKIELMNDVEYALIESAEYGMINYYRVSELVPAEVTE